MPITPHFELSQSLTHVTVEIRVPHVRVSVDSVEIVVDKNSLHFYSSPYLLVLNFPHSLVDNEEKEGVAKYDPCREGGMIILSIPKKEPAIWPDLDLMGALMAPKKPNGRTRGGIEILNESSVDNGEQDDNDIHKSVPNQSLPDIRNALRPYYGFLNMHSGVFEDLSREGLAAEMLQLPNPDTTPVEDRTTLRRQKEEADFDANRYLGDLYVEDDYIYQMAMNMVPHWQEQSQGDDTASHAEQLSNVSLALFDDNNTTATIRSTFFTPEESAQLASIAYPLLPNNISTQQDDILFLGFLDILFAYVYDHLMTDGDPTIESCWTICILSPTLSWLDTMESLEETVINSIRRAMIYPYLRNYELALHCWNQVCLILKQKRHCVIRCLLEIHSILKKSESHYLANLLFIDAYLAWMQRHVTEEQVSNVCHQLETLLNQVEEGRVIGKDSLGLNLAELERQLNEEEEESDDDSTSSESDDESLDEENSSTSDDDTCSSRDVSEGPLPVEGSKVRTSTELLDAELGSVNVGIQGLTLNTLAEPSPEGSSPPPHKPLIEEL